MVSGTKGRRFESCIARQKIKTKTGGYKARKEPDAKLNSNLPTISPTPALQRVRLHTLDNIKKSGQIFVTGAD